ncbi:Glycosyl transferase family 2 [Amycolatopsis xylanica]|uniref:Glycosyl transferase family 2 n=1 Tax=Amycolatopsis xylanica TaxID=589385 RepID=A0A1H3JCG9_9PSEU|nr:glycosyltransferase family 2 protein [Amycolatopsis xylanica]SDY36904.1 Glycosyl transferase family 2 [Amycolatopsis xylanica]
MPDKISIVVLAKNEERCIARCLASITGHDFEILVVDTGSADETTTIAENHPDARLVHFPWSDSFGAARNFAIDHVSTGWIVFLDADEWLSERAAEELKTRLSAWSGASNLARLVLTPTIFDVDRGVAEEGVPRVFHAESSIRYRGPVHEYPVVEGEDDVRVELARLGVEFQHDGYHPEVARAKDKLHRNLRLLDLARAHDPDNPRWWYYTLRDGLPVFDRDQIVSLCETLRDLPSDSRRTGELLSTAELYRLALGTACQGLAALRDWRTLDRYCAELDRLGSPDGTYFRLMAELHNGVLTTRDLLGAVRLRGDEKLVATSAVDPAGRHLDALIVALLARLRGEPEAERYRALCEPWTDVFFDGGRERSPVAR